MNCFDCLHFVQALSLQCCRSKCTLSKRFSCGDGWRFHFIIAITTHMTKYHACYLIQQLFPSFSSTFFSVAFFKQQGGLGLGLHFPGFPVEPDWTKALGVFAAEQPAWFGAILLFISIAEGESVGHSGDNWRNMGTKTPGNNGLDPFGLTKKLSEEKQEYYKIIEKKNGRAAMIAMASLFAMESIPGSVPIMDVLN